MGERVIAFFAEGFFNGMPKPKKEPKVELNPEDYADYGDFMAAKRAAEGPKAEPEAEPEAEAEEAKEEEPKEEAEEESEGVEE